MTLTRDAILAVTDLPETVVDVPEWGGSVRLRGLSAGAAAAWQTAAEAAEPIEAMCRLVALSALDLEGRCLFTEADVAALGGKSMAAIRRVFNAAAMLNGLGLSDEDAEKNSSRVASASASPSPSG